MKQILIIILLVLGYLSYSQESYFVKGKGYYGYVFSKDQPFCGLPIERDRISLTEENIFNAERILRNNINTEYVKSCQFLWKKPPINKRTLKNYYRQYLGYINSNNEIIVRIYLTMKKCVADIKELSDDLIIVYDGGYSYWYISINLQTQQVLKMNINGES